MLKKIHITTVAAAGFLLAILFLLALTLHLNVTGSIFESEAVSYDTGWLDDQGKETAIMKIPDPEGGTVVFSRELDGSSISDKSLCFVTHNIVFSIYADDMCIYEFYPKLGGYYGKSYGNYIHTVTLPSFSGTKTLTIRGTVLLSSVTTGFENMVLQNSGAYIISIAQENMWKFIICLLTFAFGAILFLFGFVENLRRGDSTETMYLGVITMMLGLWTNSSTLLLQIFTGNSATLRIIDYAVLCLLPVPILIFVASFTKNRKNKLLHFFIGLSVLNFLCQAICVPLGLFDYTDVTFIDHLMMVLGLMLITYLIIKAIRRKLIDRSQRLYLISALGVIALTGMADMVRFYTVRSADSYFVTRIGLVIFAAILTVYEFGQYVTGLMKIRETELMQRLAMEDMLTGLNNRTAFVYYEKELLSRQEGKCLFIHLDVNYLKKVNDTYGHAEGDRHIIAAANAIRDSFGEYGRCFRVGGDEFFVVIEGDGCQENYAEAVPKFKALQSEYNNTENPPVLLCIAHGTAEYDCAVCNPEEAEKLADSRMYEDKKNIKAKSEECAVI